MFTDEPFVNEMCLMVLVALRHGIERSLISFAARTNPASLMSRTQYQQNLVKQQKLFGRNDGWAHLLKVLNLKPTPECEKSLETLRLLANCYKHQAAKVPSTKLLTHLGLPLVPQEPFVVEYMSLPESRAFRVGLAMSVNLSKDADYCAIVEKFVEIANQFLDDARKCKLASIRVSLVEFGS
jgi:hypothetical protein